MLTESPTHTIQIAINRLAKRYADDPASARDIADVRAALERVREFEHIALAEARAARRTPPSKPTRVKGATLDLLVVLQASRLKGVEAAQLAVMNCNYRARVSELRAAGYNVVHDRALKRYVLREPLAESTAPTPSEPVQSPLFKAS